MKIIYIRVIILFFFMPAGIYPGEMQKGVIVLDIEKFPNNEGVVWSHIFNDSLAEYFPTKSKHALVYTSAKIKNQRSRIVFPDMPYGTYALTVHHDENENEKMDKTWIGYPDEGFGLSMNPKIFLSVPDFDDCKFKLEQDTLKLKITMKFV